MSLGYIRKGIGITELAVATLFLWNLFLGFAGD